MTFDEAVREYQLRSSIGPLVQGMKLSPFVNVPQQEYDRVKFLNNLFSETINELRKEYAPTVEMTKEDKQSLLDLKSRATFYFFNQSIKKWQQDRIGLQMPYGGLTEDKLMSAWLHPETIKIVDE